jgi:hypothetical protein
MTKQEKIKVAENVHTALAAAQSEMGKALRQSDNPHFRSKYADLGNVMDACLPALNAHGISVIQPIETGETYNLVKTILTHGASGTSIECAVPLILGKKDMQGLGSAITYARRYGLMAMAGIAPEDDDGNAAANAAPNKAQQGLQDAWKDSVLDSIPEDATPTQKAEAFAEAICREFTGKGPKALQNAWERRKKYIAEFEAKYPHLHDDVTEAFMAAMKANEEQKKEA